MTLQLYENLCSVHDPPKKIDQPRLASPNELPKNIETMNSPLGNPSPPLHHFTKAGVGA